MEIINIINKRGKKIVGDLFKYKNNKELIILSHGFLEDKHESQRFDLLVKELSKIANVFRFDFVGSGLSEDEIITLKNEIEDLESVILFFQKLGFNIHLLGFSLGGYISIENIVNNIKSITLWNPILDKVKFNWKDFFEKEYIKEFEKNRILKYNSHTKFRKENLISKELFDDFEEISKELIKEKILNFNENILIIYGENDNLIPINDIYHFNKIENISLKKTKANHEINEYLEEYIQLTVNFFNKEINKK